MPSNDRRVRRLLRWYPASWRETHEEEFSALLEDSIADRPFWSRRGLGVALEGSRLRLLATKAWLASGWLSFVATVFVGYSLLFIAVGLQQLLRNVGAGQEAVGVATTVVAVGGGVVAMVLGVIALRRSNDRIRAALLFGLGISLFGLFATAWWRTVALLTGLPGARPLALRHALALSAKAAFPSAFTTVDPLTWQFLFSAGPQRGRLASYRDTYAVFERIDLVCLIALAICAVGLIHQRMLRRPKATSRLRISGVAAVLVAVTAGAWVWARDVGTMSNDERVLIPGVITATAVLTLVGLQRSRCRTTIPGPSEAGRTVSSL
jgi:hypothetical protein